MACEGYNYTHYGLILSRPSFHDNMRAKSKKKHVDEATGRESDFPMLENSEFRKIVILHDARW